MSEYDETFDTCDDCGRRFPRTELRRCKICGHYVCPECRGTHVARFHKAAAKPVQEQPSYAAPAASEYHEPEPITYGNPIHQEPVHSRSPAAESPGYYGAPASEEVMACVDCGREFPKSKLKKCNICNGAVCIHCQPSHLSKKHGHFLYSDFDAPAASKGFVPPVVVPPAAEYHAPSSTIHFREELDENPIGHASADYSYHPDPVSDYSSSLMEDNPSDDDPGDGRIKCDDCGGYFNKDELRTCKKCGHHVCPECRSHHKCPKPVKAEKPPKEPKEPKPPKEPKQPKQHKRRKHDELGDPIY